MRNLDLSKYGNCSNWLEDLPLGSVSVPTALLVSRFVEVVSDCVAGQSGNRLSKIIETRPLNFSDFDIFYEIVPLADRIPKETEHYDELVKALGNTSVLGLGWFNTESTYCYMAIGPKPGGSFVRGAFFNARIDLPLDELGHYEAVHWNYDLPDDPRIAVEQMARTYVNALNGFFDMGVIGGTDSEENRHDQE